jgi:hypothetical protein
MTAGSDNPFPKIIIRESANDGSDFSNPAADYRVAFIGEDGLWHVKDSAGTVTSPYTGGGTPAFVGAFVYHSTTQNISTATSTAVTFDSELIDTASFHEAVTNPTRITVGTTGKYRLRGGGRWAAFAGPAEIWMRKNGTTSLRGSDSGAQEVDAAVSASHSEVPVVELSASDYVELMVYQASGVTQAFGGSASADAYFAIEFLGT